MDENVLLYEKILIHLKDKIEKGELLPGDRLPTEMELAQEFGVSRITSKRALEELRADGLIYRVRGRGSFVAGQSHQESPAEKTSDGLDYGKVIAFVIPFSCTNGGVMETIKGASKVASEKGYILDIKCSNNDLDEERSLLQSLYDKGVGGIIFYPISDRKNLEILTNLSMNGYPIVSIDKYYESVPVSYVVSDNLKGEYDATRYLLDLGHKKIAFLSDTRIEDATSVRNRYFGYCKALKENGLDIHPEYVKNGDFYNLYKEPAMEMLEDLVKRGVTGFCCINDYVANLVLHCLQKLETSVPEEASVIGFDDLDISEVASVPLTTVHQDMERMGECAARYVVDGIESGKYSYMQETIPVKMVLRESCAGINSEGSGLL